IFSYPLIKGDRNKCLNEANAAVLSESMAKKYFGNEDPMGKPLQLKGRLPLKVTGVFKDVPDDSHLKFDMIISFLTLSPNWGYEEWTYPEFYNYVLLQPGADPKKVEAKFPAFIEKHLGNKMKEMNFGAKFFMQPVSDIHLKSNY